jgi:hypothetical protein
VPDKKMRDFGTTVPEARVGMPGAAEAPAPVLVREARVAQSPKLRPVFVADTATGPDLLGLERPLGVLAALVSHPRTETPLAVGLLGPAGCGKTFALRMLVGSLAAAAKRAGRSAPAAGSPAKLHVVEIDAGRLDGPGVVALAEILHAGLVPTCPGLVGEAIHASRDPRIAAREAFEALDIARRKLAGQRLALESEEARRAGLVETVLFETPGTQIDAYVRANRTRFKHRLAGLGVEGEPIHAFKQLVQHAADGMLAKTSFVLRSVTAFRGQAALVILAVLLGLAGLGLGYADAEREGWLGQLRESDATRAAATWLEANMGLLDVARRAALIGAGLAVAVNLLRAARIASPVFRASAFLAEDLAMRRRHADVEFGHEVRRVETLAAEVDALASNAAEAERRAAEDQRLSGAPAQSSPFLDNPEKRRAERFIAAVGRLVGQSSGSRLDARGRALEAPDRIVVALDGLDSLEVARAREILAAAHGAFGAGFVFLIALDLSRSRAFSGDDRSDAWIQVPFHVGAFSAGRDLAALVRSMLESSGQGQGQGQEQAPVLPEVDLDGPLEASEASLLSALAPLAGRSPRAVKRLVNLYRLGRLLCPDHKGMLALMLALDAGGTEAEIEAFHEAFGSEAFGSDGGRLDLDRLGAGPRLAAALASVRSLMGEESLEGARDAAETARLFSFGPRR